MGTEHEVLIEEAGFGRTRSNYKMRVEASVSPGDTVRARVTNADRATLNGVVC